MSYIEDELCKIIDKHVRTEDVALLKGDEDIVVDNLSELIQERAIVGEKKYKTTMARMDLYERDWVQHSLEEALDFLVYQLKLRSINPEDWWWLQVSKSGIIPTMVNHVIKLQRILLDMDADNRA